MFPLLNYSDSEYEHFSKLAIAFDLGNCRARETRFRVCCGCFKQFSRIFGEANRFG